MVWGRRKEAGRAEGSQIGHTATMERPVGDTAIIPSAHEVAEQLANITYGHITRRADRLYAQCNDSLLKRPVRVFSDVQDSYVRSELVEVSGILKALTVMDGENASRRAAQGLKGTKSEQENSAEAFLTETNFTAATIASVKKGFDSIRKGEQLSPQQISSIGKAVEQVRNYRLPIADGKAISYEEPVYDIATEAMLDALRDVPNASVVSQYKTLYDTVVAQDTNQMRNQVSVVISAVSMLIERPVSRPPSKLLQTVRSIYAADGIPQNIAELRESCKDTVLKAYMMSTAVIDSQETTPENKLAATHIARGLLPVAEAMGVQYEGRVTSSASTVDGKKLSAHEAGVKIAKSDLPRIRLIEGRNGSPLRAVLRTGSVAALAGVASTTVFAHSAAATEVTVPTTQATPTDEQDMTEIDSYVSPEPTAVESEVVDTVTPDEIIPSEAPVDPVQSVPEQTQAPSPEAIDAVPSSQASPENPMEVDLGTSTETDIDDPDILEDTLRKEQKSTGWDRTATLEKHIANIEAILNTSDIQRVNIDMYIDDVDGLVAEFDSYIGAGGVELSRQELIKYRLMTLYAQVLARYPAFVAVDDKTKLVPETDFVLMSIELFEDTDLPPQDAYELLSDGTSIERYTPEQRRAILKMLAGSYELLLNDADQKDIVDLYAESKDPKKDKNKEKKDPNKSENNDHDTSKNLSIDQINARALNRMEEMGPQWANRAKVMKYLMKKGFTAEQAAGAIGNFCIEAAGCELNAAIEQLGGGPGRGIVQWGLRPSDVNYDMSKMGIDRFGYDWGDNKGEDRVGTLRWFAKHYGGGSADNWKRLDVQLGFILWELNNSQKGAGAALRNASSVYEATDVILNQYERPAERIIGPRLKHARDTMAMLNKLKKDVQKEHEQHQSKHETKTVKTGYLESHDSIQKRLEQDARNNGHVNEDAPSGLSGFVPSSELSKLGRNWGEASLQKDAATSFRLLAREFEAEFGKPLLITGGYRTFKAQQDLREEKGTLAATPGTSEHGWGMAVDISTNVVSGWNSKEYKWLLAHAEKFGWEKPEWSTLPGNDPEQDIDYKPELWHWEYEGGLKIKYRGAVKPDKKPENKPAKHEQKIREKMPVSRSGFTIPVATKNYRIGTTWGGYENIDGFHTGLDIPIAVGEDAFAVAAGEIVSVGVLGETGILNITLKTEKEGLYVDYQHLSRADVKVGDHVEIGEKIGETGNSGAAQGYSTGPHLHIGFSTTQSVESRMSEGVEKLTKNPIQFLPSEAFVNHWEQQNQKVA